MSTTWLLDVLDREFRDKVGADRDRLALAILDALPVDQIADAITDSALVQLRAHGIASNGERERIARDIGANAAMAVAGALDMHAGDDETVPVERVVAP